MSHLDFQKLRDGEIIDAVGRYPMLSVSLTQTVVPMPYRIAARRLPSLSASGLFFRYADPREHLVGYSAFKLPKSENPQIAHRLMESRFSITADLAGIEITGRVFDHELRAWLAEEKCPLVPDLFSVFQGEPLFMEFYRYGTPLTRNTSDGRSILQKCFMYEREAGRLKDLFGISKFRVVIILETVARRDSAWRMLRENGYENSQAFLLGAQSDYDPLKPESIRGAIFITPREGGLRGLFD